MTKKFAISISSPPHHQKLVADIFFGTAQSNEQWAELSQDEGILKIEFYPRRDRQFWEFNFDEVMEGLSAAKARLIAVSCQS